MTNYKEVFQLAQDKGFPPVYSYKNLHELYEKQGAEESKNQTILIELTLIQKWLRDEKKMLVIVRPYNHGRSYFTSIYSDPFDADTTTPEQPSYEEALLQGIHEALKLL